GLSGSFKSPCFSQSYVGVDIITLSPSIVHGFFILAMKMSCLPLVLPSHPDQTMYSSPLCSNTEPSIAHLSEASDILPLKVHAPSSGSADEFSSTYIRWFSFLPSSAAK